MSSSRVVGNQKIVGTDDVDGGTSSDRLHREDNEKQTVMGSVQREERAIGRGVRRV